MKDVMLDFETLGNGKNKCLCQVGACYFDPQTGEIGAAFKVNIDAESHTKFGGVIDAPTVYWWLAQSKEAQASILAGSDRIDVVEAMKNLNIFLAGADRIWSHATFDFVTLVDTMKQLSIKPSFSHKAGLDLRTLAYLARISITDFPREGVHHDALDDCKHQVKYASAAIQAIKGNRSLIKALEKLIT